MIRRNPLLLLVLLTLAGMLGGCQPFIDMARRSSGVDSAMTPTQQWQVRSDAFAATETAVAKLADFDVLSVSRMDRYETLAAGAITLLDDMRAAALSGSDRFGVLRNEFDIVHAQMLLIRSNPTGGP